MGRAVQLNGVEVDGYLVADRDGVRVRISKTRRNGWGWSLANRSSSTLQTGMETTC